MKSVSMPLNAWFAGFIQHLPDRVFLVNNFADFQDVRVKKKES